MNTVTRANIEVVTTYYEALNGREPRGCGLWWFTIGVEDFCHTGSFAQAKKYAIEVAHQKQISRVFVCA